MVIEDGHAKYEAHLEVSQGKANKAPLHTIGWIPMLKNEGGNVSKDSSDSEHSSILPDINGQVLEEVIDESYEPTVGELEEYAGVIGIDPDNEPQLMYIAIEGINAKLPEHWKPFQDTKSGDIYYFNFRSCESTWDHPCDEYYKKMVNETRIKQAEDSIIGGSGLTLLNTPGVVVGGAQKSTSLFGESKAEGTAQTSVLQSRPSAAPQTRASAGTAFNSIDENTKVKTSEVMTDSDRTNSHVKRYLGRQNNLLECSGSDQMDMIDVMDDLIRYSTVDTQRTGEERQRLVGSLQTDLQEILDDKKAELKKKHDDELNRYKRELESKTQLTRSELSTAEMTTRTKLEQEHEEIITNIRKEFEKQRESIRSDHKDRISRIKNKEERQVEEKSRLMEERKQASDEDGLTLDNLQESIKKQELHKDSTVVEGSKLEDKASLDELSSLRQALKEAQSQIEQLNIEKKQLQEKLRSAENINKTDTMDNTADLIRYGTMDIDMLEPAMAVGASTDLDVSESYESYQETPRVDPEKAHSSNKPKVAVEAAPSLGKPQTTVLQGDSLAASYTRALAGPVPCPERIDESAEVETSEVPTDSDGTNSPVKLFASLNLAESLDEQSHLLEGWESEQAMMVGVTPQTAGGETGGGDEELGISEEENTKQELLEEKEERIRRPQESEMLSVVRRFQQAYLQEGANNFKVHGKYLEKLGDLYFDKYAYAKYYEKSPSWTMLLKAFTLYNTAAVEFSSTPDDYWNQKVWTVVNCYLGDDSTKTKDMFFASVDKLHDSLHATRADIHRRMNAASASQSHMMEIISFSNEQMCHLAKMVITQSLDLMMQRPPCEFSAVAFGSIGRGEATPYSDLEYLFLIEDERYTDYFEQLAVIGYFLVGALRETCIHSIGIPEISDWFIDKRRKGFQIDGITETSGNVPTGKESMPNNFIKTPQSLIEMYTSVLNNPNQKESQRGDLTAMLTFTTLIYTSQEASQEVSDQSGENLYWQIVTARDQVNRSMNRQRETENCEMLKNDLRKFRFLPDYDAYYSGFSLNVKRLLYRFPSLLVLDISTILNKYGDDSWKTLSIWKQSADFGDAITTFADQLLLLLLKACYSRLQCYLSMNSRSDRFQIEPLADRNWVSFVEGHSVHLFKFNEAIWKMAQSDFFHMSAASITLQHHIWCRNGVAELNAKAAVATIINNQVGPCEKAHLLASFFCCDWHAVVNGVQGNCSGSRTPEASIQMSTLEQEVTIAEAFALLQCCNYQRAMVVFKEISEDADSYDNKAVVSSLQGIAKCHFKLGELANAKAAYQIALDKCRTMADTSVISSLDISLVFFESGTLYIETGENKLALGQLFKAMELLIKDESIRQPDKSNVLNDFHDLSYIERLKYVSNPSRPLAHCLFTIAEVFKGINMVDIAMAYYNKAHSLGLMIVVNQQEGRFAKVAILHELGRMFTKPDYIEGSLRVLKTLDDDAIVKQLEYDAMLSLGECLVSASSGTQCSIDVEETVLSQQVTVIIGKTRNATDIEVLSNNAQNCSSNNPTVPATEQEADAWFAKATAASTKLSKGPEDSARIYQLRADLATAAKQFTKAKHYYEKAKDEYLNSGQKLQYAEVNQSMAKVHAQCKEYELADRCFSDAQENFEGSYEGQKCNMKVANVLMDRVENLKLLSRPDEAQKLHKKAQRIATEAEEAVSEDVKTIQESYSQAIVPDQRPAESHPVTEAEDEHLRGIILEFT